MSIYSRLVESEENFYSRDIFKENIKSLKDRIKLYLDTEDDEERSDLLGNILIFLEKINTSMNQLGITYTPDTPADETEEAFQNILATYIDVADKFMRSGKKEDLEAFNVQNRYLTSLVDIHRTQYIEEGEVLIDPET